MSELIRDTFIHLHSADLIGELRAEVRRSTICLGTPSDQQFIDRYGEHRIPVSTAKAISSAGVKRRDKDAVRSSEFAALTGSQAEKSFPETDSSEAHALNPDSDAALEDVAEATESASIELSADDVAALAKQSDSEVEQELVGSHRFVKFKDVLPPCPPRGVFDVRRIKDSAYFFS
jgi:DNA-directed RNA polymerase